MKKPRFYWTVLFVFESLILLDFGFLVYQFLLLMGCLSRQVVGRERDLELNFSYLAVGAIFVLGCTYEIARKWINDLIQKEDRNTTGS